MALKPVYTNTKTLKKLTVGGATYFLKDEDLRKLVESFGSSVYKDVVTTFDPMGADIATESATAEYIKGQITKLTSAMRYMGLVERPAAEPETPEVAKTDLEAIAAHYATLKDSPMKGDVVIIKDNTKEYIYDGTKWEEFGDQSIYLTIASAAATYVPKTRTIAGVDMADDIQASELEAPSALNLKALAHKESASGTVEVAVSAQDLTVAKEGAYTVTGDTVAVPQTFNAMDVTPAGTIEVKAGVAAAAIYQKATGATIAATDPGEGSGNYTPAGTIASPTATTTVSLQTEEIDNVTSAGTGYTISDGAVSQAEDSKAKFVKKGMSYAVDEQEEALTLAYVENSDGDFYADAVTAAGAVSYTKQELSGALPTFGKMNVAKATGATASTTVGAVTFNGTPTQLNASLSHGAETAEVTQPTFTATFSGTTKNVTPEAATSANAQAPSGTVTITTKTAPITLNKETKTVEVK